MILGSGELLEHHLEGGSKCGSAVANGPFATRHIFNVAGTFEDGKNLANESIL